MFHLALHRWNDQDKVAEAVQTSLGDHLHWMRDQQLAGRILIAGPTPDRSIGIMMFNHMSATEVDAICSTDPFITRGFRSYELIPWDVHHLFGIGAFEPVDLETQPDQHDHGSSRS